MPINRECPKCGHTDGRVRHNRTLDEMELSCFVCDYEWRLKPLDVLRADKERTRAGMETRPVPDDRWIKHDAPETGAGCTNNGKCQWLADAINKCPHCRSQPR